MTHMQERDCVFCKVVRKELKTRIVYEDKHVIGILETDTRFSSLRFGKEQCVVFPKKHVDRFYDLDDEDIARLFQGVKEIAKRIKKVFQPELVVTLTQRQQTRHAHVSVFADRAGRQPPPSDEFSNALSFSQSELDEIAEQIRSA